MAKTVSDAAILLEALIARDEQDPATWRIDSDPSHLQYSAFLDESS